MARISSLISGVAVVLLTAIATVGLTETVESTYWNEAAGVNLLLESGHVMTAAEDALRVLRSLPLTQLSASQRRHIKRRILSVLGLDHAPRQV